MSTRTATKPSWIDAATRGIGVVVRSISWQARHHAAVIDSSTGLLLARGARERVGAPRQPGNQIGLQSSHWRDRGALGQL